MTKRLVIFALAVMTFAAAPQALKADDADALCPRGNATLHGTYMTQGTGSFVGVGPMAAVGVWTFDGEGNSVLTMTVSVNGAISRASLSGTYTVKSNCTMTISLSGGNNNYDGVVAPDGNTGYWVATDPGTAFNGTVIRPGHPE